MSKRMSSKLKSRWSLKTPLYLEKTDKRYSRHVKQLKRHGFSDAETWGLDSVIVEFVLPRLKRFKEIHNGFPGGGDMTEQKWEEILDKMIFAFEFYSMKDDWSENKPGFDLDYQNYEEGMRLFAKWLPHLWW